MLTNWKKTLKVICFTKSQPLTDLWFGYDFKVFKRANQFLFGWLLTRTLTKKINSKTLLKEDRIVALLAEVHLVAIEAKYYRNCCIKFNRRYEKIFKKRKQTNPEEDMNVTLYHEFFGIINENIVVDIDCINWLKWW